MKNFDHQTRIFEEARDRKFFGLLWQQGCGKTRTAIHLAEYHYNQDHISACLVLTTKGLVRNWSDIELPTHSNFPYAWSVWPKKRIDIFKEEPHRTTPYLFYWMVNIDAIRTDSFVPKIREFMKLYPNFMAIVDESTIIKSPSAKRTKRAWRIGQLAKIRLIMTGLPTPRSPLDLYAQCRFLLSPNPTLGTPDALGFKDFYQFKMHHANIVMEMLGPGRTFPRIDSYKNLGELKEKLSQFSSIVRKDECLDLPPIRQRIFPVPLTNQQQGYYDELQEELLTYIEGEEIEAKNILAMINKSLQICSGQIKLPDGRYVEVPTDRLEALEELVEECQSQTIVWTAFVANATSIGRHFGKDALLLPSGLSLDQRQAILGRFKKGKVASS